QHKYKVYIFSLNDLKWEKMEILQRTEKKEKLVNDLIGMTAVSIQNYTSKDFDYNMLASVDIYLFGGMTNDGKISDKLFRMHLNMAEINTQKRKKRSSSLME